MVLELNGCFGALLGALGFDVDHVSCRTYGPEGGLSPDYDHLALLVRVDGDRFLADVGWGDQPLRPVPAEPGDYDGRPRRCAVEGAGGTSFRLLEAVPDGDGTPVWMPQYESSLAPRTLAEFADRSQYLQTAPGLAWTERPLVTQATSAAGARVTLHRDRLRVRDDDLHHVDHPVTAEEWPAVLRTHFGLEDELSRSAGG